MELELPAVLGVGACGRAAAGGEAPGKWAGREPDVSASARWRAHSGQRTASREWIRVGQKQEVLSDGPGAAWEKSASS